MRDGPGIVLNRRFYEDVVRAIVGDVDHAAALVGWGSQVLGFDDDRSADHGWGPQMTVFVGGAEVAAVSRRIDERLPETFEGFDVRFGWDGVDARRWVEVSTVAGWFADRLRIDVTRPIGAVTWLTTPQQLLLEATAGAVFHDGPGALTEVRAMLAWYPDDVWRYLVASQFQRLAQEEAFVGRTAEVGDDLGSRLVAARVVRDVVRLAFLLERRYAPYSKWLGTAFGTLALGHTLGPALDRVLAAPSSDDREAALADAYGLIGAASNELGVTGPVDPTPRPYHGRPFVVLHAERFAEAWRATIDDPWLRERPLVGGVDQFADSTDVLSSPSRARALGAVYEG